MSASPDWTRPRTPEKSPSSWFENDEYRRMITSTKLSQWLFKANSITFTVHGKKKWITLCLLFCFFLFGTYLQSSPIKVLRGVSVYYELMREVTGPEKNIEYLLKASIQYEINFFYI